MKCTAKKVQQQEQEIPFARYWKVLMGQVEAEQADQEEYAQLCKGKKNENNSIK